MIKICVIGVWLILFFIATLLLVPAIILMSIVEILQKCCDYIYDKFIESRDKNEEDIYI